MRRLFIVDGRGQLQGHGGGRLSVGPYEVRDERNSVLWTAPGSSWRTSEDVLAEAKRFATAAKRLVPEFSIDPEVIIRDHAEARIPEIMRRIGGWLSRPEDPGPSPESFFGPEPVAERPPSRRSIFEREYVTQPPVEEDPNLAKAKRNPQTWQGPRTRKELEDLGYIFDERPRVVPCRGCRVEIFWVTTPRGKKMPLHVEADGRFETHFSVCDYRGGSRR